MRPHRHVLIAGISSALGCAIAERVLSLPDTRVTGYYRNRSVSLDTLAAHMDVARLTLREWSVSNPEDRTAVAADVMRERDDAIFLYCCGRWAHGPVIGLETQEIEEVVEIGLTAPADLISRTLRAASHGRRGRFKAVIVTGLGGERTVSAYTGIYCAATTAMHNFIRAVGEELAGSPNVCMGIALGLFDKGQPYIENLCSRLSIKRPSSLSEIADLIADFALSDSTTLNGSVVELSGGLLRYKEAAQILDEVYRND